MMLRPVLLRAACRWWRVYSSRKMSDPTEEYTANSLVYDPNHLPNSPRKAGTDTAPAQ